MGEASSPGACANAATRSSKRITVRGEGSLPLSLPGTMHKVEGLPDNSGSPFHPYLENLKLQ
jgi:hypothetical protein